MAWRMKMLGVCAVLAIGCGDDAASSDGGGTTGTTGPDATTTGVTPTTSETGEASTGTAADGTGSTSNATTSDVTGTGTDGTESGSDSDDSTTTGEQIGDCYDTHPFAGELCGPAGSECVVAADEVVDPQPAFRNDAPAITVDDDCTPQILYSVAEGGFEGFFARRIDDDWQVDPTPFDYATGGLTYDAVAFRTLAVPYDGGDTGTSIWSWDGDWIEEDDLAGNWLTRAEAVDGCADGTVHFGSVNTDSGELVTWTWPGFGFYSAQDSVDRGAVAVGSEGVPHTAVWSTFSGNWGLYWSDGTEVAAGVAPLGSAVLERSEIRIAVTPEGGPDGTGVPHILFAQDTPGPQHGLRYATPADGGGWDVRTVADEDPAGAYCDALPTLEGETCDYDFTVLRALGVVASEGGDVRLLYTQDHVVGTLVAECMMIGGGPPVCNWQTMSDDTTSEVMVAWPDGDAVTSASIVEVPPLSGATVELAPDGVMHVAAYASNTDGTTVRYLALSP